MTDVTGTDAEPVTIAFGRRADLNAVYRLDLEGYDRAWPADSWKTKLLGVKSCVVLVARAGGRAVGYLVAVPFADKVRGFGASYDLIRCAVLPEYRRRGVARRLCGAVSSRAGRVILREENLTGLVCARACGFRATRVLKNYFDDGAGVEMWRPAESPVAEATP